MTDAQFFQLSRVLPQQDQRVLGAETGPSLLDVADGASADSEKNPQVGLGLAQANPQSFDDGLHSVRKPQRKGRRNRRANLNSRNGRGRRAALNGHDMGRLGENRDDFEARVERERVALRIELLKEKRGLSNAEFARRVGVDRSAVSHWFKGRNLPRFARFHKIAVVLSTTVPAILGDRESPARTRRLDRLLEEIRESGEPIERVVKRLPRKRLESMVAEYAKNPGTRRGM